ncbi:MAG: hypothetical protein ACRD51_09580, partial [Candidatus Acidiferrum sp.]
KVKVQRLARSWVVIEDIRVSWTDRFENVGFETKRRLCGCPFDSGGPAGKRAQAEACATKNKSADKDVGVPGDTKKMASVKTEAQYSMHKEYQSRKGVVKQIRRD